MVTSTQRRKRESRRISVVGNRYLTTPSEDIKAVLFGVVICRVCRSVKLLELPVVTSVQ
jgi:hypothetical protein